MNCINCLALCPILLLFLLSYRLVIRSDLMLSIPSFVLSMKDHMRLVFSKDIDYWPSTARSFLFPARFAIHRQRYQKQTTLIVLFLLIISTLAMIFLNEHMRMSSFRARPRQMKTAHLIHLLTNIKETRPYL